MASEGLSKTRLEALSDGVFSIAMTLLVLDLKVPHTAEIATTHGLLARTLLDLWPKAISFCASFLQAGVFWIAHHGYLHFIKRTDRRFLWLNLLFLMLIVVMPFSTNLLGDYPRHRLAAIVYGCNLLAIGLALYALWAYATHRHRLVGGALEPEVVRLGKLRMIWGITTYACAVLLAAFRPVISLIIYIVVPLPYVFTSRLDHHWTHAHD